MENQQAIFCPDKNEKLVYFDLSIFFNHFDTKRTGKGQR
jgi:hypothetical protein